MKHLILLLIAACVIGGCAPTEHCTTFDGPDMQALCTAVDAHYMTDHVYFGKDDPNPHYNTGMMTDAVIIESFGKRYAVVSCLDSTVYTCTGCDDALWQEYRERKVKFKDVYARISTYKQIVSDERRHISIIGAILRFAREDGFGRWNIFDHIKDVAPDRATRDSLWFVGKRLLKTASAEM